MTLAKGAGLRAALSRLLPVLVGAGLLAGCQSASQAEPPAVQADEWRVIERSGEVRYLAPGTSSWAAALPATPLPGGSRVMTGEGGRLILARASDYVSAGPASRFSLPGALSGAGLVQTAGRLRYRLAEGRSFAVVTPALAIESKDSVFDVTVGAELTAVAVERGRVRVATPGREREIELGSGQSAEAGGRAALAYRRVSGQPLEPVERIAVPALQPQPALQPRPALQPVPALQPRSPLGQLSALQPSPGLEPLPALQPHPAYQPLPALPAMPVVRRLPALQPNSVVEGVGSRTRPTATGAAAEQASTSATASVGSVAVVAVAGPATGSMAEAAVPDARAAVPAATDAMSAARGGVTVEPSREASTADPLRASPPVDEPAADEVQEDGGLLFDRLTEGMIDGLPVQRPAQERSARARTY